MPNRYLIAAKFAVSALAWHKGRKRKFHCNIKLIIRAVCTRESQTISFCFFIRPAPSISLFFFISSTNMQINKGVKGFVVVVVKCDLH